MPLVICSLFVFLSGSARVGHSAILVRVHAQVVEQGGEIFLCSPVGQPSRAVFCFVEAKVRTILKRSCITPDADQGDRRSRTALHDECYGASCASGRTEAARDRGSPSVLKAKSKKTGKNRRLSCREGGCARACTARITPENKNFLTGFKMRCAAAPCRRSCSPLPFSPFFFCCYSRPARWLFACDNCVSLLTMCT